MAMAIAAPVMAEHFILFYFYFIAGQPCMTHLGKQRATVQTALPFFLARAELSEQLGHLAALGI